MKINKFWTLTLLSLISSTQMLSADWVNKEIKTVPVPAFYNQVVLDNQGNSKAYWLTDYRLYGAILGSAATKWQSTNDFAGHPKGGFVTGQSSGLDLAITALAISKEGTVASLWAEFPMSSSIPFIKASLLTQGSQVWETPKIISIDTFKGENEAFPHAGALTFDSQSRLHAAWNVSRLDILSKIQTAYLDLGASKWSNPVTISIGATAKADNTTPLFANNPLQDRIVAVWTAKFDDGSSQIYGSYLLANSKTWSAPKALSKPIKPAIIYYSIAQVNITTNKNHAVISWIERVTDNDTSGVVLRYAILDSSNKWIVNQLLDSASSSNVVSLAIDPELTTTFVYDKAPANSSSKVYSKTLTVKNKLSSAKAISDNDSQLPKVVVDASGKATAIWAVGKDPVLTYIFSSARVKNGAWTKPEQISSNKKSTALGLDIDLALNAVGTTVAIWNEIGPTSTLEVSAIQQGNLPLAPTNVKGRQGRDKLLLQKGAFYNKISWQKSSSKDVLSYAIYRDGKYLASVDAKAKLSYADAPINVGSTYLYSVKAVNKTGVSYPAKVLVSPK